MHRPRRGRENAGLQIAPTLKQDVWNAPNSVMDNVSRLEGQVFSLRFELQNVDNLFLDWTYSPVMNRVKRGLDVEVTIKLKEWTEDTVLELLWTSMGSTDRKGSRPLVSDSTGVPESWRSLWAAPGSSAWTLPSKTARPGGRRAWGAEGHCHAAAGPMRFLRHKRTRVSTKQRRRGAYDFEFSYRRVRLYRESS